MNPTDAYKFSLLLLCIWREARGESLQAKIGVAWSIRNRVNKPGWWGKDWDGIILHPFQYSSFNPTDPNANKIPYTNDMSYLDCEEAAMNAFSGAGADPTLGATSYFDKSLDSNPPSWAAEMTHACDIGGLHFYKS